MAAIPDARLIDARTVAGVDLANAFGLTKPGRPPSGGATVDVSDMSVHPRYAAAEVELPGDEGPGD